VVLERLKLVLSVLCNKPIVLAEMKCGEFARNVPSEAGIAGHLKGHKMKFEGCVSDSVRTCVITSTTCRFRETAFLEDISTGLIRPTQSLQHNIKGYCKLTRACWPSSFALSSSLSVQAPLVDPLHHRNLRPPMDQMRTSCFHLASSASCLSNVRFAFTRTPKGTDARSRGC
jgi:hypothetical protein